MHLKHILPSMDRAAVSTISFAHKLCALVALLALGTGLKAADLHVTGNLFVTNGANIGNLTINSTLNIGGSPFNGSITYNGYEFYLQYASNITGGNLTFNTLTANNWEQSSGNFIVVGDNIGLGSWYDGTTFWPNAQVGFLDQGDHVSSNISFTSTVSSGEWVWQQNGSLSWANQMDLDSNSNLTLTNSGNYSFVSLVPSNSTASLNTGNGTVTHGFESLYISSGSIFLDPSTPAITLGGASMSNNAWGSAIYFNSTGVSYNWIEADPANLSINFSSGFYISTSGNNNINLGSYALAIGDNTTATGFNAMAIAGNSSASGGYSFAVGNNSIASGSNAIALGGGNATGNNSIAIGTDTTALTDNTTVIGRYNIPISSTGDPSEDPAFIVGIGNNTATANGLVILNNGTATLGNTTTLANPTYVSPTSGTQPLELQVDEDATFNGAATLAGNIVITQLQGDVPVGEYDATNSN